MSNRLPFTKVIHHPTKSELVLANGQHFLVVNTSTGELIKTYPTDTTTGNVTDNLRCLAFNKDGSLLATSGENKEIVVWDTENYTVKTTRPANKRINAVQFTSDSAHVTGADKFGDVYSHSLKDETPVTVEKLAPILGHVSMVTDMVISPDDKLVITSDRDEHIRVSCYPNGYNIECFCLGHTDVVTCLGLLPWNESVLASSGGDGTVRLWDYAKGNHLQTIDLKQHIEAYKPPVADANSEDAIVSALSFDKKTQSLAVAFAKSKAVIVLSYKDDAFTYKETLVTDAPILDITYDHHSQLWISHDGEHLVSVYNHQLEKQVALVETINKANVCLTDKLPDLYTIFGLRKFLDETETEETANKRRKKE